jgi:hypothetical protein
MMSAPEDWTAAERARANVAAMMLVAELTRSPRELTQADRETLRAYSGWGGLSLRKLAPRFPAGIPLPDDRQLIHDYYTPQIVCDAIAQAVAPLLPALAGQNGAVHALEPSAGIGRFISAFAEHAPKKPVIQWQAVEYSKLSAALLQAYMPGLPVFVGPFERWVAENGDEQFGLVMSNPPYGERGPAKTEDPERIYRGPVDDAWAYFLRRTLDLLEPGGLGVYVIPSAFLTGTADNQVDLRKLVLLRHHLAAAFRLPSGIFAGATAHQERNQVSSAPHVLNTDVLFFRARGGELAELDAEDQFIIDGDYYGAFPEHVLGQEYGGKLGKADNPRKDVAYQVVGEFKGLPALVERPICTACRVQRIEPRRPRRRATVAAPMAIGAHWLASAASLGRRVRAFLADVARGDNELPALAWQELHTALTDWTRKYGAPSKQIEVLQMAQTNDDVASFVSVFDKGSDKLIPALRTKPTWEPRYKGRPGDVVALADWTYRQKRALSRNDLGNLDLRPLFAAGWCEDRPGELVPAYDYYTGELWPKYDRARARADGGDAQAAAQASKLLDTIRPLLFDDIEGISPRQGWVPLDLIAEWAARFNIGGITPKLIRQDGLLQVEGFDYETLDRKEANLGIEMLNFLGWVNHHGGLFLPPTPDRKFRPGNFILVQLDPDPGAPKTLGTIVQITDLHGSPRSETNIAKDGDAMVEVALEDQPNIRVNAATLFAPSLDEVRLATGRRWERAFREWCGADPARRALIETTYQRTFQGYRAPPPDDAPVPIARWTKADWKLHSYQSATVRRLLAARGGLAALDVGLGKTAVGIAALAAARQEGWAKRPVVLVPNSLAEKWVRDILALLPDYRVGRIGWKKKLITRGRYRGKFTTETDTPADRARTWSAFQAGEYDVVVLTYTALARTRMDERHVSDQVMDIAAVQRQLALERRSARRRKKDAGEEPRRDVRLSERREAILQEGVARWVAEQLELPPGWDYDPGITWDELGVDLLVVDEAQNFKNLFMPEEREGGVPKFMGNPGAGSGRAWNLDFRAGSVRRRSGGAGVILLSATPAKNSPLEFYNLLRYVDHLAFARLGVSDPEQFIDRYCDIELRDTIGPSGEVEKRSAVVGFKNLDELRGVIFRYAEFKTAEQVGLKIPEAQVVRISVDLNDAQEAKFRRYLGQIEAMRQNPNLGNPLGLMARLNLVAIHPELENHYGWKDAPGRPERTTADGKFVPEVPPTIDARKVPNPHSPKLDAVVREILGQSGCGHIVFCDNVAVHRWLQMLLIEAGIPEEEIGILNAEAAPSIDARMRIAQAFTGTPAMINGTPVPESALAEAGPDDVISEPVRPTLRVVLANQVAYEGVDLQTETCQIHNVDLPYEPATLQQRAGRAVRQGNKRSLLPIKFYFAARSLDGFRFNLIQGKLGWMDALIAGTARSTNNPAAQEMGSLEDQLIELSRDPEQTKELQEAQRERRRQEAATKIAKVASATLRAAAGRFAVARETTDPARRQSLVADAEKLLAQLEDVNRAVWPWLRWAIEARKHSMLVPLGGQAPVYETLRVAFPDTLDPDITRHIEFGKSDGQVIGGRVSGTGHWKTFSVAEVVAFNLRPEHAEAAEIRWPSEDDAIIESLKGKARMFYAGPKAWTELGWSLAPDAWVEGWWPQVSSYLLGWMERFVGGVNAFPVPVLFGDVIGLGLGHRDGKAPDHVFPPTEAGWQDFLRHAVEGDKLKGAPGRADIARVGSWWWGRTVPRDLFIAAEFAEGMAKLNEALATLDATPNDKPNQNKRLDARMTAALRAIEVNDLRPLDEATMRRVAAVLEGLDDRVLTNGLPAYKVRSLIALRQRVERAPVPSSQDAAVASARDVAPAAVSQRAAAPVATTGRAGTPAPVSTRAGAAPFSTATPSQSARIERQLEDLRGKAANARTEKLNRSKREMREGVAEEIRELVGKIRAARNARRADLEGRYLQALGEAFLARAALRDPRAVAYWTDGNWDEDLIVVLARWARMAGNIPPAEQLRLFDQAARSVRAPASAPHRSTRTAPVSTPARSAPPSALDDELMAALELDPELADALELDGDDDELMAALELDPELEGALELDAVV